MKVYKVFILRCQAFVSSQESEEKTGHLRNLPPLLPSYGPSPYLSAYQSVSLTPSLLETWKFSFDHQSDINKINNTAKQGAGEMVRFLRVFATFIET